MLYEYLRVFKESSGTFTDYSLDNQEDSKELTPGFTSSQYLYVAQYFPSSNLFFHLGDTVNATATVPSVEYWDGTAWRAAVDILDATSVSGASLGRSGNLQFQIDTDYNWMMVADSSDNHAPAAIQSLKIYDCYWYRVSFSNGIDAATQIKEMAYAFTSDQELKNIDVEIDEYLTAFDSAKVNWIPEIITASKMVVIDMRRQGMIFDKGQVIRFDDVFLPATYKALDLIYMNLGPTYKERRIELRDLYQQSLNVKRFTVDANADGKIDRREIGGSIKRLVR